MSTKDVAQALFDEAFSAVRQPRSGPYQLGCINYLRLKLDGVKSACPFRAGSAECDAYLAGVDEGRDLLRQHSLTIADGEINPQMAIRAAQARERQAGVLEASRQRRRSQGHASTPGQEGSVAGRFLAEKQAEATDHRRAAMPPVPLEFWPDELASDVPTPAEASQ